MVINYRAAIVLVADNRFISMNHPLDLTGMGVFSHVAQVVGGFQSMV